MTASELVPVFLKAHGTYPRVVYRAFDRFSHAEDFALRGRFRLGNLRTYQKIEDSRRQDPSEDEGHFQRFGEVTTVDFFDRSDATAVRQRPGYVHTQVELLNPRFVLSCSRPDVDLSWLRHHFGAWLVKIEKPRRFAQEISDYLQTLPHKFADGVEGCIVKYSKGAKIRRSLTAIESTTLSYSQKPQSFSRENEFRFVAIVTGLPSERFDGDYLMIDLGRRLEYVSILDTPPPTRA